MDVKAIAKLYGLDIQEIEKLEGYASLNYRVKSNGTNYLLKHYSSPEEYNLISQEEKILSHISRKNLPFEVPSCRQEIIRHEDASFSRLLPFIEGSLLSSVNHTDTLLCNFGEASAMLNQSLSGIKNDAIQARELDWDLKHTLLNSDKVSYIKNPNDRKVVIYFLDLFEHRVLPIQRNLRAGIIHSDLNDNNVIVANDELRGFIDFGDIAYSPIIYEVAIAITYVMLANENDPFQKAKLFLEGYHSILPLRKEEIELLSILIPSRLCVSVCNSAKKKSEGEDTEYVLISERPAWHLLHKWLSINPKWIDDYFLSSVGLETTSFDSTSLKAAREEFTGSSLSTSYKEAIFMTGAAFQYMYDNLGNTYLDAYNNIPQVGHNHPNISKVISQQVRKLNTNTRYLYPELTEYAEKLSGKFPGPLHKVFFVNSGSAASDLAIRMAQTHTNKSSIAILKNGYHGHTISGITISDYKHSGKGGQGKSKSIISLPLPKIYQGQFSSAEEYAENAIHQIETEIKNGNKPAAMIVEPISGCGGQVPLATGYLKMMSSFLKENQILLIVDEVQTGFGRLGEYFWGFEMHQVMPDIVIIGKPMGNGHPLAAAVCTKEIADSFDNGMEFFTSFGGNPVSCKVGMEVLNIIEEEGLQENAKNVGKHIRTELSQLGTKYDSIGDVRGEGLFIGVEFINSLGDSDEAAASFVKERLKERLILVSVDGPNKNVIKIKPPLCFNMENANHFLKEMEEVIKSLVKLARKI